MSSNENLAPEGTARSLLARMREARQVSAADAESLAGAGAASESEESILRWVAREYGVAFTTLDDVAPDRQLLPPLLGRDALYCFRQVLFESIQRKILA